jgi:hypothetical protein
MHQTKTGLIQAPDNPKILLSWPVSSPVADPAGDPFTTRKAFCFRTFRVLELAPYHPLAKLPEPETTHDFF